MKIQYYSEGSDFSLLLFVPFLFYKIAFGLYYMLYPGFCIPVLKFTLHQTSTNLSNTIVHNFEENVEFSGPDTCLKSGRCTGTVCLCRRFCLSVPLHIVGEMICFCAKGCLQACAKYFIQIIYYFNGSIWKFVQEMCSLGH